ncbi:Parvalbumin beta [Hondaea fermentalgiana]|uniref:Parvalbumin beta n=1 Tax=Hondaea fermentalgiana TaxID=2315210 RepID=A0A2R5GQK8_9STRA|nr:Parvalbumin beta [Hondaea fermentalgiana]|eukprot:GBG30913.1 Parvalbumin beta [Hondaea fermentalgiana]
MFRFNGRCVPSEVLRVNVDVHFQGDEHAIENALANSVHHASCEIALTSSKFAAELRLGDSQHLANLKDYGVQVYVEISFEADEGPSSSARELSAMAQPGYVCFRQAKLRRFDPLALTEGDDIVGMRVKFGTSGERVCFPLLQMSDLVPSPLRKHHTDRAGTFESSSVHMLTSLYEVESFQVEIFTATGSHGECQFTYGDNETWLALSGQQGQVYLAWDFVPMAAPETELDQERSDAWLVAIMTNRIIGLGAASSLGPSDVFVEIHMLDPGNTLGAEAVATHKFRTMTRDPRDIFAESSQCVLSSKFAPGQNRMPRTSLLRFEMKSARNVLLGECTIDISSLYCVASASKTGITVPLHCTAGKLFLDVILDVVQLSHAAAWIRDRNRGIRGPRKTSTPSQSEAIIEVIGAQKLRHAKGLLKTSVSETNRPTNAQITRSQPHGGASNPEWEEEKLTLDAEDIAHKRFVCESLLSKTGLVWLLTARLFANDKLLGASTWIEIPRHKDLTQVRPILYKGRFAGLLEVTASEQVQAESVVVHGSLEIAARIRVDQTWYMTQFCKSMTPQSPTQVLVFQQRLGPYRLEGTALGFEAEIAIIESTSGEMEERVIGCVQLHFVAQHLHACSYKIPDTDMHIDLLVERFPSRGEAEGPDIELAESSLYEAVLNVPKEFDLSLETLVFSADAIIPCRPLQTALNNQIVCLGLGQPALRSSFESLRLTASQSDGTLIEATYEVHQNELRLLMSEAGTHSLPSVFTWSFHETRYVSLLPMLESDDFFSLNVERVEGLPSTWRSCRVRLVLISAKGPSYDVAGLCANVSLSEGSAFIAEEFHFERFGRVAPVGLRIVVLGDGGDASLETYAPVRKLAQAHFQIKVSDEASVSFSREEHATPDSHLPSREKNNTRVMNDPQLEPFVAAFARFDPKESGSIPAGVVAQLVGEELAFLLSDRNEQNLALELALLDTNSDGVVTFDEYLAWVETKRPASSVPAVPPPKAAHHLNVRLSISHVECSSQLNARIIAKALPSGAKDATSSATGPRMTWPKPAVLKIPCEKNLELFLVENHTGKVRAKSSLLEPEQLPDTLLLHGAPVKVRIEVTCARGLRAADNVGFIASHIGRGDTASSDPYCVVRVGKLSKRTKVCKDTCDPDWNESLEFDVDPGAHSSDQQNAFVAVQIEVRDKDTMSLRDDFLGSCEMHCTADLTQETLSLQGKNARGTLTLRAQITAFETAKLSLQSEIVTDITVDVLDRAIAKRTATLNEALRYSDEADQMLSKIPAPFRATKPKLAFELTPRPPKDGRRSLRRLVEAVNQAPAMPPSTLVKLHEEIQDRIFAFSSEHFGHVRGRAQRPPANPREYDVLLQLSGQLREHMRQSKGICIIGELKALRTLPSTKNADVILRELVSSEEALRAHISSQLSKLSSGFDPQEAHAKRLLSELTRKGDIPTAMDLEETVRMWTEERKQRDHSARQERELAEYIENKQGELGSALGRRRDHLRTSSRADVLYAQNLAGTRHDAIESLRKSLAQADDCAERASSAALKNRLARLQSLETLLAKFEPPGSTELLAALHAASLDRETTPVTLVELTASLLYPAIMDAVLTAHELAVRFVYAGAPEVNDAKRFFRLLKRRMVRDHRKKVLHEAVCARLDALGGRNDIDAWTIMRASDLAKSFIVGGDAEDVDGESLSESARQQAIKLIKDSFLSRADLLRMGGILHVEANCSQHSLRASLDGNDLAILAGDQTSIADEHRVEIPPQSKAEGVLHLDLLPFDPQATHFTRIMYHLEDLMQRPGVALRGHFQAQELELKRVGQGLVRIEVILSASNAALALQCFVQGSFPIPGFISREHDMSCTWNLSSSSHEKKDLFFPGRDCRATSNVEVFAALFDRENMAQPLGGPVPLRLDMDSPQSIGEGIGVKLSFQPDDNLLDRIRKERAAVKMTALGRGFLARRGAQLLGTAEFNLQASGLVGKTGSRHPSMSVYCSVHYGDTKLAATNAAKRMGASPDFGQIRLPIYKGWDGALAFKVWEQASLVGQCELSAAQLAATQASEEVTLALRGGLRSKQGAGLQVHVVRARANLNFAPPDTMCSVRLLTSERGQGNKRTTRPRPVNASSTVEWNEGFIYRDWTFGVEEELRFEMCNSENEHVEVFTLRLENVLSQQKHTEWLKCSSSQSSLLVKAWALEVLDDPDRCGNLKITDMKLLDTVTSHSQPQPHPTSLSGPCKVIVHVLEARDLGEDACRPKVRCELLPWGQARPLGCGETGRTWSDGSHARWTRSEMNKLELSYPGSDGRDSPAIEIELWNAEHEPIVGHARVPFHSFSDDMWINLNPRGRIRFRVKVDADEGRLASARRVEASMCFKPRLNASNSKLNSSELHQEASDLMLLEELKMVSAEDLVQHVAQTPRLLTAQNELRRTALHQAVIMNQPKLAHILLEAGANLSAVDTQDKTPVDYARSADMLRALGVLAPHSVLVSQRSQMQGLETVLQHLSLRDKAFATAELVESEDTSQEKDDDDTGKEADTDGNDDEVLDNGDLVRRSSPTDDQSGKNEVLPAAEEAMFELLYDVVEQANGPDEVFDLFDMDGNGWVDGDEFEGSMRELLSIQSAADDRLEIVRTGERFDLDVVRQAWLKTLAREEREFEDVIACFVRKARGESQKWPTTMELSVFVEAVAASRDSGDDSDNIEAPARFIERLCERLHIDETEVPAREIVERMLVTNGRADEEIVTRANDHLLQSIVELVRREGHGGSVNDFRSISRRLFETLDGNGSGAVDRLEFTSGMRQLGVTDASAVQQLFDMVDVNHDGRASVEEFVLHIERFIYRKQAALDSVLATLRKRTSKPERTTASSLLTNRPKVARERSKRSNRSFEEVRISCYDEMDELLILDTGKSLRLGADAIEMVWDSEASGTGGRGDGSLYGSAADPEPLLATMRGYMERNDVMERREARRLAAVVQIQSCARGFLLRSAERRLTQREHDFIIRAVQTPFRKGFMAQLTIDAPRLAQEVLRMKLIMSPACEDSTTQLPIYGLAVEAQQSAKSNVDVQARMQALRKVLRSFGVVELESEVKVSCFRDKRGQTGVAEVLEKVILLDDEAMLMQTALDLAQEITNMHPVHDVTQVSAAIMRVMSENPALTDGPKDNVKVTGTAMFKSFRYLQDNAARSFAWVQTKAKTSNRVYTRSLELESFQGTRTNDREDAMLDQVRALALVSGQFDAYGLMRALVDGNVSVDAVQDAEATLTAQWNGIEYQICARLAFAKKRKVTAGKGYNHVPARPLCKHADLHSVLMVSRGSAAHHLTDSSLQQQTNGASVDPQVLRVDFSELEMGERSAKLLQRAVWMPPAKTKVFAQRVYLHQSDVAHSGQGNGGLSVGRAGFRRVRWIGKLVTSSETSEQVEVDAWRLTEQSTGGLQLRLVIPGGHLGWFSIQECKSMLRLCLRVDVGPDDMFERTSKILSPFEETGRLLTGLLGHIRERVRDVGDARRVFLRHGFETSMPRGALEDVLKRRLECLSYLRSVEGVLDAEEAEEVMGIFLDLFPDPLTLEAWQGLCEPPIIDTLTWISRALHSRPGGLVYMRAKFRSLGDGESLALEQVESALCEYLGDVGLVPEMLREVDWTNVSVNDSISVQALLHQLDTAHKAMRMSNGEAMSPSTGMEPGTGDEAFPQEGDDEADERDLEGGAQGDAEELVTPAQRERLVQELVDSDDEEELWGSAFFRDEAMRSALAELRFRILEYANPDVHPDRFDLEKTFRVFDQDRTGLVDADEFRKALRALHMNQLLPTQEMIVRFIDAMDGDGDGKINLAEFKRMVGPQRPLGLLRRLRRPHALQTIRWSVELFVADLGEWIPGTAFAVFLVVFGHTYHGVVGNTTDNCAIERK